MAFYFVLRDIDDRPSLCDLNFLFSCSLPTRFKHWVFSILKWWSFCPIFSFI
jgi:hypothetical protein